MANGAPSTFVKSFFAGSIQAAMENARIELGTDALLLNSREAPPEARHLGAYEVVFAAPKETAEAAAAPADQSIAALKRQMEEIRALLLRKVPARTAWNQSVEVAGELIEAGIETSLAYAIEDAVRLRMARRSAPSIGAPHAARNAGVNVRAEAADELAANFEVAPEIGRITALIGPPGCGKTTTLVKLAAARGVARGRAVCMISADSYRVGGAEPLRSYARILGAGFQAVETAASLAQAIEAAPAEALVLIDTPGCSAAALEGQASELAQFLSSRQDIDTHLVLTASMRIVDLYQTIGRYSAFGPSKLLFTRLDETSSLAAIFCAAAQYEKPVSFLCAGQAIPEDIEPATKEGIVQSLVTRLPSMEGAAA